MSLSSPPPATDPEVEPDLTEYGRYRHWRTATLRFSDLDLNGHVNNVSFAVFFQEGRTSFFQDVRVEANDPNMAWAIAQLTINFLGEMHIPGSVEIGTSILRIGRSSVVLGQGLFREKICTGTSRAVMVRVDRPARASRPITEDERRYLEIVAGRAR